jgi:hypothetical protein
MRLPACLTLLVLASGLAVCRPVLAQSLGDVSRREEERRKDVKAPAKVYTDKDLHPAPVIPSDEPKSSKSDSTAAATDKTADAKDDGAKGGSKDEAKDQKYWSTRRKDLQTKLERDKVLADAMQSRINGLTADFAARSDPAQRAVIEADRRRALTELETLQKAVKDDQKALADLDEEARKASVPPGWLR